MIVVQTPLRLSFLGGGTDFSDFYSNHGGAVLSTAINKSVYVIVKERFDDMIYVNYSINTRRDFKTTLRKFYRWLKKTEQNPEEVAWITLGRKPPRIILPEDSLTENDVASLIRACPNLRDKAFISLLYESGCRIGELLTLKIKHIAFDGGFARISVSGKTGWRRLLLISSVPFLSDWLNVHPYSDNPEAMVWICNGRDVGLGYTRSKKIVVAAARRAYIKKKVNPHSFRHSSATHLAKFLTEAQMKEYFGWSQSSDMPSVYVHLSGRDVDNALLKSYGLVSDRAEENGIFNPKRCPRCGHQNPAMNRFCTRCRMPLSEEERELIQRLDLERRQILSWIHYWRTRSSERCSRER